MPTYSYTNIKNNEDQELTMTISEMEKFEDENPHMKRQYNKMYIADPVSLGVTRPPDDFSKYVLGKVKAANPQTRIGTGRWDVKKEI